MKPHTIFVGLCAAVIIPGAIGTASYAAERETLQNISGGSSQFPVPPEKGMVERETLQNIPGSTRLSGDVFIAARQGDMEAFPGGTSGLFSDTHIAQFDRMGIQTVTDLVEADPDLVGRVLEIDPRRARALQEDLHGRISER